MLQQANTAIRLKLLMDILNRGPSGKRAERSVYKQSFIYIRLLRVKLGEVSERNARIILNYFMHKP